MIRMNHQIGEPRGAPTRNSTIDCSDCKNHWLIKEEKEIQVLNALCKEDQEKTLFHQEIKQKLNSKCK